MVKYTGRGLVVKRPGILSKVQMLNLVLGVGVFSLLPISTLSGALAPTQSSGTVLPQNLSGISAWKLHAYQAQIHSDPLSL